MSATILDFASAAQRLKGLRKCEPGKLSLIRADAEDAIAELEREAGVPDNALYIGPLGEWLNCDGCGSELSPTTTISQNLNTGDVHCVRCFHRCGA